MNRKLLGSNILSFEYTTGVCPTQCEQCFCNFGFQGVMITQSYLRKENESWRKFVEDERKLRKIIKSKDLVNLPVVNATKDPVYKKRIESIFLNEFNVEATPILRVSAMSDCSYYPKEIIQNIVNKWGDFCFFNSSIKSFVRYPSNIEKFVNKVVITTNPGNQNAIPPKVKNKNELIIQSLSGSGGRFNFFSPATFTSVGKPELEDKVKFYRLRAIQTIIPNIETDKPVVLTPIRFKSLIAAAAWAKRYSLSFTVEARLPEKELVILKSLNAIISEPKSSHNIFKLHSLPEDKRNVSCFRGQQTTFRFHAGWWRQQLDSSLSESSNIDNFICDRAGKKCKACGLCAMLDGTQPGWHNKLNIVNGKPFPIKRKEANYLLQNY